MPVSIPESEEKSHACPCCKFKTLRGRGQDEICKVCFWHDDGQDEAEVDEVRGGPNGRIPSLAAGFEICRGPLNLCQKTY
jgi:hypothetical protein